MLTSFPEFAHTDPILERNKVLKVGGFLNFKMCKFINRDFHKSI